MDLMRRTYTARCRFIAGRPPHRIRWYWTLPGAKLFPYSTAFGTSAFDDRGGPPKQGPGELTGGLLNFNDGRVAPHPAGVAPVGSPELFLHGLSAPCDKEPHKGRPWPSRTQALDSLNGV